MRTIITETNVYTYDELSDAAKEEARNAYNQMLWETGSALDDMQMIADGILEEAGFGPAEGLQYSLYSQGGFPKWDEQEGMTGVRMYELSHKIFYAMRAHDEEMSNDANTAEAAEANGWEYTEDGKIA